MSLKIIAVLIAAVACVAGCREHDDVAEYTSHSVNGYRYFTTVVTINGHEYVIMRGPYCGGIVHAESCPCKGSK